MKKIELQVYAISHSIMQTQNYAVVLEEVEGIRKLPIVIGQAEAQAIAVALEKIKPPRPLTHDLMRNLIIAFDIKLVEVIIYNVKNGVFYSKLICSNDQDTIEIDSRTSDAIALAIRLGSPIYTYESIMSNIGMMLEGGEKESGNEKEEVEEYAETDYDLKSMSIEELQGLLNNVLEQEDYIKAIAIRDEIDRRK
jgi:bifunctional DNase/RNase